MKAENIDQATPDESDIKKAEENLKHFIEVVLEWKFEHTRKSASLAKGENHEKTLETYIKHETHNLKDENKKSKINELARILGLSFYTRYCPLSEIKNPNYIGRTILNTDTEYLPLKYSNILSFNNKYEILKQALENEHVLSLKSVFNEGVATGFCSKLENSVCTLKEVGPNLAKYLNGRDIYNLSMVTIIANNTGRERLQIKRDNISNEEKQLIKILSKDSRVLDAHHTAITR
ncbi:MAG: hypothetical protein ACK4OM_03140 [Alphaproteobacteria bacterium]